MTATAETREEGAAMADQEFDPALVTSEQVVGLTKKQCAAVLEHYKLPKIPASWQLSDFRRLAHAAVLGHEAEQQAAAPTPDPEPEPAPEPIAEPTVAEEPGTALEAHRPTGLETFPDASRWQQITSMSHALAKSKIVPEALRGQPDDITVVLLAAHDLGIAPTQALNKVHVINGKPGLAAELMVALALRDGHSITPDADNDRTKATVHYRRRDNGDSGSVSFTIEEAIDAKLCYFDDSGKIKGLSKKGEKKVTPWETFPADMLWARAVSRLMRRVFPDALAGISYTPDELGYIDADDDPVRSTSGRHGEATVTLNEQREKLSQRAKDLPGDEQQLLVQEWKRLNLPLVKRDGKVKADFMSLSAAAIRQVDRFLDGLLEARGPAEPSDPGTGEPEPDPAAAETSESPDPGQDEPVADEADAEAVPEPGTAPEPTEAVEPDKSGDGGVNPGDDGVVDVDEICTGCGQPMLEGQPTVEFGPQQERYHVGHEPF